MNSSKSGQLPFSDVDDDMELEKLFGFLQSNGQKSKGKDRFFYYNALSTII